MSLLLNNNVLKAAEQRIESSLTSQNKADYLKIVVAGMSVAIQGGPNSILAKLKDSKNPISDCAMGAINLCLLMRKQSRGTMPERAMVPAAMTLMLHALDFADKAGIVKVGTDQLVQATHIFTNDLFKKFGISQQMIQTAAGKVHALTQDPVQMEKLKMKAGFTQHPMAATPTPLPDGGGAADDQTEGDDGAA